MEAEGGAKKRLRRRLIIIGAIAAAAVLCWVFVISPRVGTQSGDGQTQASLDTTTLAKTDLEQTVTATGSFSSAASRTVSAEVSADVKEVYVEVGDEVTEGQVLCKLDTSDLDEKIETAEESLSDAVAKDSLALSQAERKVAEAKRDRTDNNDSAKAKIASAKKALAKAKTSLSKAKASLKKAKASGDAKEIETAEASVEKASTEVSQAQEAYEQAVEAKSSSWKQDTSAITQAQDSLATQKLNDSAEQARTELEGYEDEWDKCTIKAPIDGIVTSVNAVVGESSGGSSSSSDAASSAADGSSAAASSSGSGSGLFTIQDLSALEISTTVAEYDATTLKPDMPAHITSDTFEDRTWEGSVKSVSPVATDTSGNFTVVVSLDSTPGALTAGMSAKVEIVVESKEDVYAVPIDAVVEKADGSKVVYAVSGGAMGAGRAGRASGGAIGDASAVGMTSGGAASGESSESGSFTPPEGGDGFPQDGEGEAPSGWDTSGSQPSGSSESTAGSAARTEIPVTTGMETDYYIEISGSGLYDGLRILNDPLGVNVQSSSSGSMQTMIGGPGMVGGGATRGGGIRIGG
jgi:multidrug efflux pump subunit AcrA (membrane-fusion protein)